ncbi:MAG TPA: hypothetical protein VE912_11670 [Bacteroidales bacterium]|nr:hypothetical protein [Bacteroidales bacterium]
MTGKKVNAAAVSGKEHSTVISSKEIEAIFSSIDGKIISLHDCSGEDFLTLNKHFKSYYRDSNDIAENATAILSLLSGEQNKNMFGRLVNLNDNIQSLLKSSDKRFTDIFSLLQELQEKLSKLFVPLNNFRQDFTTLKLLGANLRLDSILENSGLSGLLENNTQDLDEFVKEVRLRCQTFDDKLSHIKTNVGEFTDSSELFSRSNSTYTSEIIGYLEESISIFNTKNKQAAELIPVLNKKTKDTADNIEKIITNLQYHDIIRQKIEHIQHTHDELLIEIGELNKQETKKESEHSGILLSRVKDIAGLQAAQLMQANKEYQSAIEIITGKFSEIGNNINEIYVICKDLYEGSSQRTSSYQSIRQSLEKTSAYTAALMEYWQGTISRVNQILQEIKGLESIFSDISEMQQVLENLVQIVKQNLNEHSVAENRQTMTQISSLTADIKNFSQLVKENFIHLEKISTDLKSSLSSKEPENNPEISLKNFSSEMTQVLDDLIRNDQDINFRLRNVRDKSFEISKDIRGAIENVKYYDFFDKVIEEIVNELNSLNLRLKSGKEDQKQSREENLLNLKKRYTMESEHRIHNEVSGVSEQYENNEDENTNDDNLELF